VAVATRERVIVSCPECHARREVGARSARRIDAGEASGLCRSCRFPIPRAPPEDADRAWWLERLSDTEIVEMASSLAERSGRIEALRAGALGSPDPPKR